MSLAPTAEPVRRASSVPSPYVGLVPFDVGDADFFFGRSTEVGIVVANLRSFPLTILYGPSGVGKSSLLMAGAVHDLRREARTATDESPFAVAVFQSWHEDPVVGVQEAARVSLQELAGEEQLSAPAATLAETLRAWTRSTGTLLVVLDQFEEYFQYHPDEGKSEHPDEDKGERLVGFAAELARIVNDPGLPVHILLSIREDAWAKLDLFEGHIPTLFANYVRVDHLDRDSAQEAIEGPIDAWNRSLPDGERPFEIEQELVIAVLDATTGGGLTLTVGSETPALQGVGDRVEAPFLQLVLERLWRDTVASSTHTLTLARLEALGGAAKIVENHLLDALGKLTHAEQDIASDCFRFLVSRSRTKIAHTASDLAEWTGRPAAEVSDVLDKLCAGESGHILRAIAPASVENGSKSYELFHDILAEPILIWRKEYEQRRQQEAEEQRQRAVRRRFFRIGAVLLALVAVFAVLGVWALHQSRRAKAATRSATSLALASVGGKELELDGHLGDALLLSLAAQRESGTPEARSNVISALESEGASGLKAILHGVPGSVTAVAFSPDGKVLAVAGSDGTDGAVQLWDVPMRRMAGQLDIPHVLVQSLAFSSNGKIAVTRSDGQVQLWDVATQAELGPLEGTKGISVSGVAFSPDGRTIAVVSDGKVRLRTVGTQSLLGSVGGSDVTASSVSFSPDGRTLAVVDGNGKVVLWDVGNGLPQRLGQLVSPRGGFATSAVFNPDGRILAVVSDGKVLLWDVRTRTLRGSVSGLDATASSVSFSPDGRTLAVGSSDGKVVLRDVGENPQRQFDHLDGPRGSFVRGVAFSPDANTLAVGWSGGKVRLWDLRGHPPTPLDDTLDVPKGVDVQSVAFSSDTNTLAVGGSDGTVRLWDTRTHPATLADTLGPGSAFVSSLAFNSDGRTLAAAYGDGKVLLWDLSSLASTPLAQKLDKLGQISVSSVAFSPDGHTLAIGSQQSENDVVQLWNVRNGDMLGRLERPGSTGVAGVAFDSDGSTLAAAYGDGAVQLWDVDTRTQLGQELKGGGKGVAVSPDGTVASGSRSGSTVLLWKGVLWQGDDELKERVCSFVWGNFSEQEWDDLTHDVPYRKSCD